MFFYLWILYLISFGFAYCKSSVLVGLKSLTINQQLWSFLLLSKILCHFKGDVIFPHLLKGAHLFPRMTNNFSSTFKPGKRRGRKGEEGEQKRDRVWIILTNHSLRFLYTNKTHTQPQTDKHTHKFWIKTIHFPLAPISYEEWRILWFLS